MASTVTNERATDEGVHPGLELGKAKLGAFPLIKKLRNKVKKKAQKADCSKQVDNNTNFDAKEPAHQDDPSLSLEPENAPSLQKESFPSLTDDENEGESVPSLSDTAGSVGSSLRSSLTSSMVGSFTDACHWTSASMLFASNWIVDSVQPVRRLSSMANWANRYRYSSMRPRVTATSHFVASSPWGIQLEKLLMPYLPPSIEGFVLFLFLFSFGLTLPFALTKLRTGRWTGELYQQAILNWCLQKLGFKPLFGGKIAYLPYATDEENPTRPGIDLAFWLHLVFGLSWIVSGGIQILTVNTRSRRFHRRLGYLTTAIFTGHIGACIHGLWRDVVHHTTLVKCLLLHDLVAASCYVFGAVYVVMKREKDIERHRDMMIRGYLHAIEGSGTIRFTGWILWLIGNTVGGNFRLMIDTTACQSQYLNAAATNCVVPYVFRRDMMIRGYLHAIEGSGTIRFTGWILWLIGNTVGGNFRLMIDTTACQSQYLNAAATNCVVPYVFRLQTLRLLTLYFMALYLRTPEKARDKSSRMQLAEEIYSSWVFLFQSMAAIYICFQLAELEPVRVMLDQHSWMQLTAMACYTALIIRQRSSYVREVVLMPRRNALRESTVECLEQVRQWEERQEEPTGPRAWFTNKSKDD